MKPIHPDLVEMAKRLRRAVGQLDSMVVPLANGGMDGHGHAMRSNVDLKERMSELLGEARAAIEAEQARIATIQV